MEPVPALRRRSVNAAPVRADGECVLYWMTAHRRVTWNFALQRAVEWARELKRPLVILEAVRCDYPWASARFHRFLLEGMAENARRLAGGRVRYFPYVEPAPGAGRGLLAALAARAGVVVTDEYPGFFLPRMVAAAGRRLPVRLEAVEGNGLLPLRAAARAFPTAYAFRRFLQRTLPSHLREAPAANPLARLALPRARLPRAITRRWPPAAARLLAGNATALAGLPIDHTVEPVETRGGTTAAEKRLRAFLETRLSLYAERRNFPQEEITSGLSPYLHFGHCSAHQVFAALAAREDWSPGRLGPRADGKRTGWWGMSASAEAFLDQCVTWRELGFNGCAHMSGYDRYESLPPWARDTLAAHAGDPRPRLYAPEALAAAATHDPLWNAAQRQLVREGVIHTYLRMLWGKKILEWTPSPRKALAVMIALNNRYALDGRDPNSTGGIGWVLGRYDRPWGPERPVFGKVRYMTSANTARKFPVAEYLVRYGE